MDTLFVHRSVLARTYKFSIIPIEHPFNDFSILLVLVDGDASSQNLCTLSSALYLLHWTWRHIELPMHLDLSPAWQELTMTIHVAATCYKYEWSIYSRHKLRFIASEILYWWSQLGPQVKQNWSHLLIIHGAKTIQYDLGNCNDSNFESSSAVGLWLGRQ